MHLWLGHALKTVGRLPEAIDAYRAAAAARPHFGDAYWSLANLKTYRFEAEEIDRMRAGEAADVASVEDRYHLCFALGKALEDGGEAERPGPATSGATPCSAPRAAIAPRSSRPTPPGRRGCALRSFFADRGGWGDPAPDPIFILGLPRSGSTLIEQILASHSQVEGTQELADMQRIVLEPAGPRPRRWTIPATRASWPTCRAEAFRALGEALPRRHPRLPHRRTGRSSSTRCRTTSGTSA